MDGLTRAALLGLRNAGALPPAEGPAATLVANSGGSDAAQLLLRLGARALERRAGVGVERKELPPAAPAEVRPVLGRAAESWLMEVFTGKDHRLRDEALRLIEARGALVPPRCLPALLGSHASAPVIRRLIGERGAWLAAQNPKWQQRLAEPDHDALAALATEGDRAERLAALGALRERDPSRALALVVAAWPTEGADLREALLSALGPARPEEVPFYETALLDRAVSVRRLAAERLLPHPESSLAQRALAAARACVYFRPRTGLGGLAIRLVGGAGDILVVEPPTHFDPAWAAEGLLEKPPQSVGPRAFWLTQLLGRVSPSVLFDSRSPEAVMAAARGSEWREALGFGLLAGAGVHREVPWIDALFPIAADASYHAQRPPGAPLLAMLPQDRAEAHVRAVLSTPSALVLVGALPRPWSEPFTLEWLSQLPFSQMLMYTAAAGVHAIPPSLFSTVLQHRERFDTAKAPSDRAALAALLTTVELRIRLHQELSP